MSIELVQDFIESSKDKYIQLSDDIWQYAELGYTEQKSAAAHIAFLKSAGSTVREGVAGIPTAFVAQAGSGGPVIGILGEFDALSGLSQESLALRSCPSSESDNGNGNGHGCGHHLLGTSAHLAAVAVKNALERNGIEGTVRFYGCPAEEGGWGKTFMTRAGLFDDVSAAITWHPGVANTIMNMESLAVKQAYFRFKGVAAHAGASPHLGRSALDALELMNIGTNFLREHMIPDARVHYAITDAGGVAPNVVQPNAAALYMIRAPRNRDASELYERICNIARGAALMTDCELEIEVHSACSNLLRNTTLNELMQAKLKEFGAPDYDSDELQFAESMHRTTRPEEIEMAGRMLQAAWRQPKALFDGVDALHNDRPSKMHGSTDVGDVSWVTPTVQCMTACFAFGTSPHSWQWVSQGKSAIAHKGMVLAAARTELAERLAVEPYVCPIPEGVQQPLPKTVG
ncbi:aminobenzoyl-glutamate utilization protein B [Paraburkholderia aspalathi]|uniref:Aminobenzoyl-glutamate utilization protein B n=1 Tax=Paraburkholderia aspalathi TaxID=1324617 RepID=A0A1I7DB43_9BURK|nr:aminobenzoyl-glutamate utilization protein B [Paraburkholderia aspalathi]